RQAAPRLGRCRAVRPRRREPGEPAPGVQATPLGGLARRPVPPRPGYLRHPSRMAAVFRSAASKSIRACGVPRSGYWSTAGVMYEGTGPALVFEREGDRPFLHFQPRVEGLPRLRRDPLEQGADPPPQQSLRRPRAQLFAGDRLPDGELTPVPPPAAPVGP